MALVTSGASTVLLQDVAVRYGPKTEVIRGVSLVFGSGSFTLVTGPSGAGKSTLLKLLYLALPPTRGQLQLFGLQIGSLSRWEIAVLRRRIGVVFQDFRLLAHLSVFDNVALPLRIAGYPEQEIRQPVEETLAWVGLGNLGRSYPPSLSGGQQQLVAVARAVIAKPTLILADEPTGSVDERNASRLMFLLRELNRLGATVIVATHNQRLARDMNARVVRLADGRIVHDTGRAATSPPPAEATGLLGEGRL